MYYNKIKVTRNCQITPSTDVLIPIVIVLVPRLTPMTTSELLVYLIIMYMVNPCAAKTVYIRFQADFKSNNITLKWII